MQRALVAALVPPSDVERVFAKATALWRLAAIRAPSLGPAAVCVGPACVGLAASILRVPCDLERQAAMSTVREPTYVKARNTLARLLDVRLNLSVAELVHATGCEPALADAAGQLVSAYGLKDRHGAAAHDADALLGAALIAAGAKARAKLDKKRVERATGLGLPVLLSIAARMRSACPELVGLTGEASEAGRKRARDELAAEPRGHELDLEAAEAVPSLAGSAVVQKRREYEEWRARVVGSAPPVPTGGGKAPAAAAGAGAPSGAVPPASSAQAAAGAKRKSAANPVLKQTRLAAFFAPPTAPPQTAEPQLGA